MSRLTKFLPAIILGAALCQCAGGPQLERKFVIGDNRKAVIAYQNRQGLSLSVINQTGMTTAEAAAVREQDHGLKVIPDREVQLLLDLFGAQGFFDMAVPDLDPRAPAWLLFSYEGTDYIVSSVRKKHEIGRFANCLIAFNEIYNANLSLIGSKMTGEDLEKYSADSNKSSAAIRDKHRRDKHKKGKTRNQ